MADNKERGFKTLPCRVCGKKVEDCGLKAVTVVCDKCVEKGVFN